MDEIRLYLYAHAQEAYRAFQSALLPTVKKDKILGVRTPQLKKLAKQLAGSDTAQKFMQALPHELFEENQLHAFLIGQLRDFDAALAQTEAFLPYVDNWATCDQLRPKVFAQNKPALKRQIGLWLESAHPFAVRFGIEMLMLHFLGADFDRNMHQKVMQIRSDQYYVKMMIAWYCAQALAVGRQELWADLRENRLDAWVHNKAIQKALESRQLSPADKQRLRRMKRDTKQEE